jgi:glycosyltransferase involved in cell wall biosynthesis
LAGLALFPDTEHYRRKLLTKIFEYMMAGIPVLCSNFPAWSALIQRIGCGIAVDPGNKSDVMKAIEYLRGNPQEARIMGQKGRQAVLSHYNWDKESTKLQALYQRLLR